MLPITWDHFVPNRIKKTTIIDMLDKTLCGIVKISFCLTYPEKAENS